MPDDFNLEDLLGIGGVGEAVAAAFHWHEKLMDVDPVLALSFMRRLERLADKFDEWLGLDPFEDDPPPQ